PILIPLALGVWDVIAHHYNVKWDFILVCKNGGVLFNGVCICPDEWTGERCLEENFCEKEMVASFWFPRTPIGLFAYSDKVCDDGTSNGEFLPKALASNTQILTSVPQELTPDNITTAAQIVQTLLVSSNVTEVSGLQQHTPHLCCSYLPDNLFIVEANPACVYGHWQVKTKPNQVRLTSTRDSIYRGLPFQMINGTSLYEFACVFWNYELNDWSTDGCSKGNTSDGFLRCFCNHTTNFAALWSFRENYEYAQALDWISTIGLCLSIAGLVVTIVHHLEYKVVLLCIYITLLAFIITFLSGVRNYSRQYEISTVPNRETNTVLLSEEYVEPDTGPCTAVTALLHFFLLASFLWNCVYGTQLVLLLRSLHSSLPPYWTKLSHAVGWGIPAVVTAITLAITYRADDPLGYRQEEFCWLAALDKAKRFDYRKPMFWGFLLPVGLILIYNIVLLVLTSMTTCKTNKNLQSTKHLSLRKKVLISFSVAVLLGLSWILGYLVLVTSGQSHLVFSIIFCICTTTQGFQIFILFTARTPSFRKNVSLSLQRLTEVNNELHGRTYHLWKNLKSMSTSETYRDLEDQFSKSLRR
uniref:G-protein coupled receptors family 2 profile 2 domain-containing protein n=1 Tax=Takifugu rubripes TaxID=31033 RepID=H2RNL8_TAKRU